MAGFGVSALGLFPFGIGTPVSVTDPPDAADTQFSRYINPGSGDYEVDDVTGHLKQMPPVRQRVLLALKTTLGSSNALPGLGVDKPKKIGTNFQDIMKRRVREALVQLTDVESALAQDRMLAPVGVCQVQNQR